VFHWDQNQRAPLAHQGAASWQISPIQAQHRPGSHYSVSGHHENWTLDTCTQGSNRDELDLITWTGKKVSLWASYKICCCSPGGMKEVPLFNKWLTFDFNHPKPTLHTLHLWDQPSNIPFHGKPTPPSTMLHDLGLYLLLAGPAYGAISRASHQCSDICGACWWPWSTVSSQASSTGYQRIPLVLPVGQWNLPRISKPGLYLCHFFPSWYLRPEDRGNMDTWNIGILWQRYSVSQPRGTRHEIILDL
jgi:hypothetical protein